MCIQIALIGKLRSGKSTVAENLIKIAKDKYDIDIKSKKLADPIYSVAREFYEKNGLIWTKNRSLLEGIGFAFNEHYPNGDKLLEIYQNNYNPKEFIICDDVRRIGQLNFFKTRGKPIIRISTTADIRKKRCKPGEWSEGHISDTELDNYIADYTINNDHSDLKRLYNVCERVLDYIMKEWFKYNGREKEEKN